MNQPDYYTAMQWYLANPVANPAPWNLGALSSGGGVATCRQTSTEDLIRQSAELRAVIAEYEEHGIAPPKWFYETQADLAKGIAASHLAEQEAKLRTIEQEIEHLRSNEDKKKAKEAEAEELRKALGKS